MKKLFAIVAMLGMFTFGTQMVYAQDEVAPVATEVSESAADSAEVAEEAPAAEEVPAVVEVAEQEGFHKILKTKFIEGDAAFMSLVAIAMVIGLAFCIERIIYLSLAQVNTKKLMEAIAAALEAKDVEKAKDICRNTAGPVAAICYQGLMRIDEGLDTVERSVVS